MIYWSEQSIKRLEELFYFPYTFGKHFDKVRVTEQYIESSFKRLVPSPTPTSTVITNVGKVFYVSIGTNTIIQNIKWSSELSKFYYNKSNFITFTSSKNVMSVHPVFYNARTEKYFLCDNGYRVVSRKIGKKEYFNFKNTDGVVISDIDFIQVKPFSEDKDMTARGFTPDRRCYMVLADGKRTEVNESHRRRFARHLNESEEIPDRFRHMNSGFYISSDKTGNYIKFLSWDDIHKRLRLSSIELKTMKYYNTIKWRPFKVIY